jgi:NAD(P)-dependent dehydrogenase (short-subunit alcohol dehydrogenase family)
MGRLANKNILITGGNSGIGLAAAQEFDRERSRVAICGLNEGSLRAVSHTPKGAVLSGPTGVLIQMSDIKLIPNAPKEKNNDR